MTQAALVIKIIAPALCEVRVRRSAICGESCETCQSICETPDIDLIAFNTPLAKVGDRVLIENVASTLKFALLVYLLPLVLFFIGWLISPLVGGIGILVGFIAVVFVNRLLQSRGAVRARVTVIVERSRESQTTERAE